MLILVATFLLLASVVEGDTMYVTPNVTTTICPGTPCFELNTYVRNSSSYFSSDAVFIFLPGTHVLDSIVMVANKDNIQMIGSSNLTQYSISAKVLEYHFDAYDKDSSVTYQESSTEVLCTGYNNTGFVFSNITNLSLINITFVSCGTYSNLTDKIAGIHTINTYNLVMEGMSIQNSTGYGLLGANMFGHTKITRSSFIANNQIVKETLIRGKANDFKCNGKPYTNNTIYYGNSDPALAGGNMVIQYKDNGNIVTIVFILPYTTVMLLTPCLVSKSHWNVMCWMNRLKPVIDCYEAPFKDRYRFWTGATLFYRIVFSVMFSLFTNKQPTIVLLVIVVIHAFMIVMVGLAIYKHWLPPHTCTSIQVQIRYKRGKGAEIQEEIYGAEIERRQACIKEAVEYQTIQLNGKFPFEKDEAQWLRWHLKETLKVVTA
ncbi:hypothetical protein EMCRGX_G015113 [Ephydatia muelleri]